MKALFVTFQITNDTNAICYRTLELVLEDKTGKWRCLRFTTNSQQVTSHPSPQGHLTVTFTFYINR
jgi:hypothetical protein